MNNITTIVSLIFILLTTTNAFSQTDDKDVSIIASGSGKTQDDAKQSALRSAIEQAFGAFISSKTEILNDSLVKDEIVSIANGNIKSFEILNESILPLGGFTATLKVTVSVSRLTSFAQSKGLAVTINGGLFSINIKQQILNEEAEFKSSIRIFEIVHNTLQKSIDYKIDLSSPKAMDLQNKNWEIPFIIKSYANENFEFCSNYLISNLKLISMSNEEITTYKTLNKPVYSINLVHNNEETSIYLRNSLSHKMISLIALNWQFYQSLYTISSNSEVLRNGSIHDYWGSVYETRALGGNGSLNLPSSGQLLNSLKGSFKKTLDQIEKISEINIEPKKENIIFSHGGYLIATYGEKELIAHPFGDGSLLATGRYGGNERITWSEAKLKASQTVFDGYNDYSLPKVEWLNYFMGNKPFESTNDERIFWAIDVKENDFGEKEAAVVSAQSYGYDKQWSNIADFTYYNYWPFRIHFVKKP